MDFRDISLSVDEIHEFTVQSVEGKDPMDWVVLTTESCLDSTELDISIPVLRFRESERHLLEPGIVGYWVICRVSLGSDFVMQDEFRLRDKRWSAEEIRRIEQCTEFEDFFGGNNGTTDCCG